MQVFFKVSGTLELRVVCAAVRVTPIDVGNLCSLACVDFGIMMSFLSIFAPLD